MKDTLFYQDFFARDSLLLRDSLLFRDRRQEVYDRTQPTGQLMPEALHRNDAVNALVVCALLLLFVVLHFCQQGLRRRISEFFYPSNLRPTTEAEAVMALRVHRCFVVLTALLTALLFYSYAQTRWDLELLTLEPLHLLAIYGVVCLLFLLAKQALAATVNTIFFTRGQCRLWRQASMTLFAIESLLLFPLTLLAIYFDLPVKILLQGLLILLLFVKSLAIFKAFTIFFRHFYGVLHLFVYFCALEALPLVVWGTTLVVITQQLTTLF